MNRRIQLDLRACVQRYINNGYELQRGEKLVLVRGTSRWEIWNGILRSAA